LVVPVAEAAGDLIGAIDIASDDEEEDPEELMFEAKDASSEGDVPHPGAVVGEALFPAAWNEDFIPLSDAPDPELEALDAEDLEEPVRPDYIDVFMPYINMRHFDNLAYAFVNPPVQQPDGLILEAADLGCGPDRVALYPSSCGARVAVFSQPIDRENAVANGPFLGRDVSVFFERHDEADNRFLFEHEAMAALSLRDFPLEHWQRELIIHSSAPYANPHSIDPICLLGTDFTEVLITVKADSISSIPSNLTVKNYDSTGAISNISIIAFEDLTPGSDSSSDGPGFEPIPEAYSSSDE
jgi:hypothetical protein